MGPSLWLALFAALSFASLAHAGAEFQLTRKVDGDRVPVEELPAATGVGNPVLGVLISLVDLDLYGRVAQSRLRRAAEEGGDEKIPWQHLLWVRRERSAVGMHPEITVRFVAEIRLPVPYSILGYNPGSVLASPIVRIAEWPVGDWTLRYEEGGESRRLELQELTLFGLREGHLEIDVDGWLDWLMGAKLDDIRITGMALYRHEGHRYALAFGYNHEGEGRTGVLDLETDEILFPPPPAFRALGRTARSMAENLQEGEAAWRSSTAPPGK